MVKQLLSAEEKALRRKITQQKSKAKQKAERHARGLKKLGRKPNTDEQNEIAKDNRKVWEKEWRKEYSKQKPSKRLFWSAKKRAKAKGLEFNIDETDILVPTHCPYLGIELTHSRPRGDSRRDIASLDRIDPTKGYIKGNIEVISWLANTMKNNATPELLVKFAKVVLERYEN
jgi:hypothetical protein